MFCFVVLFGLQVRHQKLVDFCVIIEIEIDRDRHMCSRSPKNIEIAVFRPAILFFDGRRLRNDLHHCHQYRYSTLFIRYFALHRQHLFSHEKHQASIMQICISLLDRALTTKTRGHKQKLVFGIRLAILLKTQRKRVFHTYKWRHFLPRGSGTIRLDGWKRLDRQP